MDHEVKVVGHQAEAEEHDRMFGLCDGKQVEESAVAFLMMKTELPEFNE
ncbi:hypothetical protein [Candidatus Manganitrophus noduliformans]|nr:hypothetical protein [Candidatus Manganitrophus noduliformans]